MKKLTILHSNDIHGKFTGKEENGRIKNSLAQVAGYVSKLKTEQPATVYCNAGDVFQGSLIDSDFLGLSTMDILNLIDIDVMSLGNHELDYGISHMMFVDKYTDFPIINANFKIRANGRNLFQPYAIIEKDGIRMLFVGLITENIIDQTKAEGLVGTFVEVRDAADEYRKIRDQLRSEGERIDITILLTHIGYEADLELAGMLGPDSGVDIIVGGHSHTYLDEPSIENGIIILQAGMENTHMGRLDVDYDDEKGRIESWKWEMIPVDEDHCPTDKFVRAMVNTYVMDIDEKYGRIVTRLKRTLDNYGRGNATEVGQLFADAFGESLPVDFMLMASSSMRCYSLDMTVTLQDLREAYPYDGKLYKVGVKGSKLTKMIRHMLRDEVLDEWHETFFQASKALHIDYNKDTGALELTVNGEPVEDRKEYSIGLQEFYFQNSAIGFGIEPEELAGKGGPKLLAPDAFTVLKDYFSENKKLGGPVDDRFVVHGTVRGEYHE